TITEVNDPPVGVDDTLSNILEDAAPFTIPFATLLANDSPGPANESSQTLTIIAVANPTGGTASVVGTGVLFTPTTHYHGPASFTYTLQDNGTTAGAPDPKSATANVSFNTLPVAHTPSITSAETKEGTQTTSGLVITRNALDGAEVTHFKITGLQ